MKLMTKPSPEKSLLFLLPLALLLPAIVLHATLRSQTPAATTAKRPVTRQIEKRNDGSVLKLAFLGNANLAIASDLEAGTSIYDLLKGERKSRFPGSQFQVTDLALSPDGHSALTPGPGPAARLWDLATGHDIRTFKGATDTIAVALSADGKLAAFGGSTDVQVWDISANKRLYTFPLKSPVTKLAFASTTLVSVDRTGNLCKWKLATPSNPDCKSVFQNPNTGVSFSADGHLALIATDDEHGNAILWDVDRATPRQVFHVDPFVTNPVLSADARFLLYGTPNHAVELWNLQTGHKAAELKSFGSDVLGAAAISSDDTKALLGNGDGSIVLWTLP
jgi:WD40 repeat protein